MAEIVYMPKLSDTMTEGVVAAWNKKVGEEVKYSKREKRRYNSKASSIVSETAQATRIKKY